MRLGLLLPPDIAAAELRAVFREADEAGLDLLAIEGGEGRDALTTAASTVEDVRWARLVTIIDVGPHPLHLAERICVADQVLNGRLTVVLRSAADPEMLAETVEVLDQALTARPFRHSGTRWTIPGRVNDDATAETVRVTPASVQPTVPLWLTGAAATVVAHEAGLPLLFSGRPDEASGLDPGQWWAETGRRWGAAALRLSRPAVVVAPTGIHSSDTAAAAAQLLSGRAAWGQDTALLRPDGRPGLVDRTARLRAAVQLTRLPDGLEAFWDATVPQSTRSPDDR